MTRIAVFAYSETGHDCLRFLLDRGETVALVVTHPDAPGESVWFPSVAELARSRGIEPVLVEKARTLRSRRAFEAAAPDLLLSFYFRHLLPPTRSWRFRRAWRLQPPRLAPARSTGGARRSTGPSRAVRRRRGRPCTSMTGRADAGDIVDQEPVPIGPDDTALEVQKRVTAGGDPILERRLGELKPRHRAAASAGRARRPRRSRRRAREDGRIDWTRSAEEVHNLVRAVTHPYPGAFTDVFGGRRSSGRRGSPTWERTTTSPGRCGPSRGASTSPAVTTGTWRSSASSGRVRTRSTRGTSCPKRCLREGPDPRRQRVHRQRPDRAHPEHDRLGRLRARHRERQDRALPRPSALHVPRRRHRDQQGVDRVPGQEVRRGAAARRDRDADRLRPAAPRRLRARLRGEPADRQAGGALPQARRLPVHLRGLRDVPRRGVRRGVLDRSSTARSGSSAGSTPARSSSSTASSGPTARATACASRSFAPSTGSART